MKAVCGPRIRRKGHFTMNSLPFIPADILLPRQGFEKWAVAACDQYTSEPEYWKEVEHSVAETPSAYHLILPEVYLNKQNIRDRIRKINSTMQHYLNDGVFCTYPNAFIYTERTQRDGKTRKGIVGAIDLASYDFHVGSKSAVRATEGTILERIPPRVEIRKNAPLELPHIMILIEDPQRTVIEPLGTKTAEMENYTILT